MSNTYTLKNSLPQGFEPVLRLLIEVCEQQGVPYFVAGATARDIVLYHVFDRDPGRQTRDIDTAILVSDWTEYEAVKAALVEAGLTETKSSHRLYHEDSGLPVDIIPFGEIADQEGEIQWPPEHEVVMSVAGFSEAYGAALSVAVDDGTQLKVASIAGLSLLKLIAWTDRRAESSKDATDFYTLLTQYEHLQEDRLWEEFIPGEQLEYDLVRMGAFLLGYDMNAILSDDGTSEKVRAIKDDATELLIDAIVTSDTSLDSSRVSLLLGDFFAGTGL